MSRLAFEQLGGAGAATLAPPFSFWRFDVGGTSVALLFAGLGETTQIYPVLCLLRTGFQRDSKTEGSLPLRGVTNPMAVLTFCLGRVP